MHGGYSCAWGEHAAPFSRLGGEIQIQLALAKAANRNEDECIGILKELEESHPLRSIQRQAYDCRYIMEAPKLAIADDERISVPVLSNLMDNKCAVQALRKRRMLRSSSLHCSCKSACASLHLELQHRTICYHNRTQTNACVRLARGFLCGDSSLCSKCNLPARHCGLQLCSG